MIGVLPRKASASLKVGLGFAGYWTSSAMLVPFYITTTIELPYQAFEVLKSIKK
jgi:hypothetical protein